MRRVLMATALLLALPAPASAAFGELPFRPVTSSAVCLAPTGVPGGLVRWTPSGAELLAATPAGLVPQASIALGAQRSCPLAAVDPGGAGVLAGASKRGVRVVVRDPGGTWSAPAAISSRLAYVTSVAVSPRGDAVVAWVESDDDYTDVQLKVARRAPGGTFGAATHVATGSEVEGAEVSLDAAGAALLVYTDRSAVRVATAAPGAEFGPARKLLSSDFFSDTPALATTPEGRALLAVPADQGTALFERAPGGEFVRRPSLQFGDGGRLAAALRSDGTAIIAWEAFDHVYALRREGDGPFAPPIEVQPEPPQESSGSNSFGFSIRDEGPPIEQSGVRVTLGADGRALLAWPDRETGLHAATVTPTGQVETFPLGSPVRPAGGMTPLVLADGSRMVAWTDENTIFSGPPFAGRLHLAVEGAADAPIAAAPEVTVGSPRDASLRPAQPLVVPVRCSAPCDVRGTVDGKEEGATASLARAGTALLRFSPGSTPLAPKRGTLKLHLSWSAPGARTASSRTAALRLRRLPAPPLPHLLNVRARRGPGGVVDVRWSTDAPARDAYIFVYATRTRDPDKDRTPRVATATQGRLSRRSFHVRMRDAATKRYVHVAVAQFFGHPRQRIVRARIQ